MGLTPLYSAVRVTPRALSLAGDASKEKRDSNGAAEGKVAVGAVGTYIQLTHSGLQQHGNVVCSVVCGHFLNAKVYLGVKLLLFSRNIVNISRDFINNRMGAFLIRLKSYNKQYRQRIVCALPIYSNGMKIMFRDIRFTIAAWHG